MPDLNLDTVCSSSPHLGAEGWNLVCLLWTARQVHNKDLPAELDDWTLDPTKTA
ncbi:hypothetical protein [Mucisphaera calidilacus]|uniref:hypothetical protein n=1 Tax=Mucisphaera calidilacus TaxID=2527982 RepID=UPI001F323721|nr:hypothetical protein [Mucisphaera calidilacus]